MDINETSPCCCILWSNIVSATDYSSFPSCLSCATLSPCCTMKGASLPHPTEVYVKSRSTSPRGSPHIWSWPCRNRPKARAINLRNAARLMICDNHKNRSQEARRIARLWEEQAAQQSNAIIHSLASTEIPTYEQSPQSQISFEGGIMRQ